jgi:hypothetical protein
MDRSVNSVWGIVAANRHPGQVGYSHNPPQQGQGVSSVEQTSPENTSPEQTQKDALQENSTDDPRHVLGDLLHALMKKGILSDHEGKAMLRKLRT